MRNTVIKSGKNPLIKSYVPDNNVVVLIVLIPVFDFEGLSIKIWRDYFEKDIHDITGLMDKVILYWY